MAFFKRQQRLHAFGRSIGLEQILKVMAITMLTLLTLMTGMFFLTLSNDGKFLDLLFEAVSAACTVGLSRGITSELQPASLIALILLMFAGRLGPLTLAYLIATPKKTRLKHPPADIQIG